MTYGTPAGLVTAGIEDWGRLMRGGLDLWHLSMEVAETLVASQAVIGARMQMLDAGLRGAGRMPHAEFGGLIREKTAAFDKAGIAAARVWTTPARGANGAPRGAMSMLDGWERSIASSRAWWAPLHAKAMSNARRLAARG